MNFEWAVAGAIFVLLWRLILDGSTVDPVSKDAKKFYQSKGWKRLRRIAIKENQAFYGRPHPTCERCGSHKGQLWRSVLVAFWLLPSGTMRWHVDHIKPRSKNPDLALNKENCQVLCAHHNLRKRALWGPNWKEIRRWRLDIICPPLRIFVSLIRST